MNIFYIYWLGGRLSELKGETVEDAFRRGGYGGGAVRAVDFYEENKNTYDWDASKKNWVKKS